MENKKVIFWAVDCQRDFMNANGALYVEGAESIKPNLKKLTKFAEQKKLTVINTLDYHFPEDEELSDKPDFKTTFPPHCMFHQAGHKLIKETQVLGNYSILDYRENQETNINVYDNNIILTKNKFNVFEGNPHTNKLLDLINPDTAVVYGVATNICVNYAVLGLEKRGISVYVVEDAIKELPNLPLDEIYRGWKNKNIHKFSLDQILRKLNDY